MSFDPYNLTPSASINRVRLVDLPGVEQVVPLRGQTAYDWLGSEEIASRLRLRADELGLDANLPASSLLPAFDACWFFPSSSVRQVAEEITAELGFCLACLVAVLKRGDRVNRVARADWDDNVWEHWSRIGQIWFGGGLMGGNLGTAMVKAAQRELPKLGAEVRLEVAPFPQFLPLIGLARSVPEAGDAALILDFGGSWVKRAKAIYREGVLRKLELLPSLPNPTKESPEDLADAMAQIIGQSLEEAGEVSAYLGMSLACYMRDNRPLAAQGGLYMKLAELGPDSGVVLAQKVKAISGREVTIQLIHDGTAAARALSYRPNSAVIQMGTALGIGFPPPQPLLPINEEFQLAYL